MLTAEWQSMKQVSYSCQHKDSCLDQSACHQGQRTKKLIGGFTNVHSGLQSYTMDLTCLNSIAESQRSRVGLERSHHALPAMLMCH